MIVALSLLTLPAHADPDFRYRLDAFVAVGLGPKEPWIFPYSDGIAWNLGEEPRIVELKPGERAFLSAVREPAIPKEARRTVVFRRPIAR